jgi:alpha,alpha-trehalase
VNASFVVGLQVVNAHMKRALGAMTPWETFYKATKMQVDDEIIPEAVEFD